MTWQQVRSSPCFPRILLDLFLIIQANVWEDQSEDSDTLISTSSGSTVYVEESEEYSNLKLDGRDRVEQADQKNPENAIENPDLRSKAVRSNEKVDGSSVEKIISATVHNDLLADKSEKPFPKIRWLERFLFAAYGVFLCQLLLIGSAILSFGRVRLDLVQGSALTNTPAQNNPSLLTIAQIAVRDASEGRLRTDYGIAAVILALAMLGLCSLIQVSLSMHREAEVAHNPVKPFSLDKTGLNWLVSTCVTHARKFYHHLVRKPLAGHLEPVPLKGIDTDRTKPRRGALTYRTC